jgi:hypothetical protein
MKSVPSNTDPEIVVPEMSPCVTSRPGTTALPNGSTDADVTDTIGGLPRPGVPEYTNTPDTPAPDTMTSRARTTFELPGDTAVGGAWPC